LARQIEADYQDRDLVLVCVLKGAIMFLVDLIKELQRPLEIDFMAVSSYGASTRSTGVVRLTKDLDMSIEGRHVLVVEDIIDSGRTLQYLTDVLNLRQPASLRICTLLDKRERREVDVPVDYVGFVIPNEFVIGYGLDFDEVYRNLPFVGVLKPEMYTGE
ncbi:MAG: hypoxanthine phosphoribosyltransferase, partial [Chloroflexi bacterium]|nr:hypoxanthine phosphoribosyltransferase [Chloroflexota bacterium]